MFTFADLFAGAGGLTAGLVRNVQLEPTFAVEFDRSAAATYAENFGNHVFAGDIRAVTRFPHVDVIVGGPPCQGFSPLGTRSPHDERNNLWREYLRAVRSADPKVFVMENVPELLRSQQYADFKALATASGYTVREEVLNAADYGAPQRRRRAIVIGVQGGDPQFPNPTHQDPSKAVSGSPWRTVRDAFVGVPTEPDRAPPVSSVTLESRDLHFGRDPRPESRERYRAVPPGGNRFDLQRNRPDITPRCWTEKRTGSTDIFGRLWWDRPSVTVRTEFFKPEKGRYLHPEADRPITHFEACRLQGFDDSFRWTGSKIEIARQIGNAVPVALAAAIGRSLVDLLEGVHGEAAEQRVLVAL
jgi:DNA (cytosine-5)-methyltransferase 1